MSINLSLPDAILRQRGAVPVFCNFRGSHDAKKEEKRQRKNGGKKKK
ncbi:hypothetical protein [Photobacterium ganghwense]|nr:hypothetical protein [Photobacterium ganghwense]MBV1840723.1 hypothetical protein [Photobacterium ganghwense]